MARKKEKKKYQVIFKKIEGLFLILFAIAFFVALLSYHVADPNLNNQNGLKAENWLGYFGASLAEGSLCVFGVSVVVFMLGFFVWGYRLISYQTLLFFKYRLFAFIVGICALSPFLNLFFQRKIGTHTLGGAFGEISLRFLNTNLKDIPTDYRKAIFGIILGLISLVSFDFVLGLTFKSWYLLFKNILKQIKNVLVSVFIFFGSVWSFIRGKKVNKPKRKIETKVAPKAVFQKEKTASVTATVVSKKSSNTVRGDYVFPDLNLLSRPKDKGGQDVSQKDLDETAKQLEEVLQEFGVNGKIVRVRPGPVVTLYELEPAPGTKTARVIGLSDDIARSMCAVSVRIAVVPGSNTIGIELPNIKRETVWLKDLLEDEAFRNTKNTLNIVLGKDIGGQNTYADLAKMPHLLVAGTTGSGKSVGVNSMILSLLFRLTPEECRLIMIDPKMLEFSMYNGIPHLLTPVITDPAKAVVGLKWAVREMEERYRKMAGVNVRNISGYNQKMKELQEKGEQVKRTIQVGFDPETGKPIYEEQEFDTTPLPYIVIVVDEMADLMLVAGKEVEAAIQRLAQMARAAGIHLIMSTQRPSVDVITGTIKANFPSRISFQVTSKIDSRTILGEQGAEQLLGMGDMLYMPAGLRPLRIHGSFVKDSEVEAVVEFLKSQREPEYVEAVTEGTLETKDGGAVFDNTSMGQEGGEDLYMQAVSIVRNDKKASTSYIQRRLRIGYNRAADLIDRMEKEGIVSEADHVGRREVIG